MDEMDGVALPVVRPLIGLDGSVADQFNLCLYTTPTGVRIQCVPVAFMEDGKYLMAFPHQVWHRLTASRVLPPRVFQKPTMVEIGCALDGNPEEMSDQYGMRVWMGYVNEELFGNLVEIDETMSIDYPFKTEEGLEGYLPFLGSLAEAAREHFAFLSAESGAGGEPRAPDDVGSPGGPLKSRVAALEKSVSSIAANLEFVVEHLSTKDKVKSQQSRVTFAPSTKKPAPTPQSAYPSLDPSVVSAALAAGVSVENLQEMERMVGSGASGSRRLREPALRRRKKEDSDPDAPLHLSEEEELEAEEELDEPGSPEDGSPSSVAVALSQLTKVVTMLSADKMKKAKSSKIEQALDAVGSGTGSDLGSTGSVKRAAAARRALRLALQESPEEISNVVERLMTEDLMSQTLFPGMPPVGLNARAWLEHRSRVGAYKTSAYCAWSACGILDDLIAGRVRHARARAGLLILQLDQTAIDRGSWVLASELSLEQGPPLGSLANHTLPSVGDGESPFSKLLDARWSEVMLSHIKDAEDYVQKRRNLGRRTAEDAPETQGGRPKAKPKPKPKAASDNAP